jgi:hypothetical protein
VNSYSASWQIGIASLSSAHSSLDKVALTPYGLVNSNYRISYGAGTLTVIPATMSSHLDPNVQAVTGKPVTGLLTKVDNVDPFGSAASYSATIDWGDGTTTAGKVVAEDPAYYYDIYDGGHTYAQPGTYTVTVTASHKLDYTTPAIAKGTAQVTSPLQGGGPPVSPAQAFVQALYHDLLGRDADAPGLQSWTADLQAGGTRLQVVEGVWASPEHRGRQVDQLYATYLHRAADAYGRGYWTNALLYGASEEMVIEGILTSAEYQQAHAGTTAYLLGLYADTLGRTADPAGLDYWQAAAQSGMSPAQIADGILGSLEVSEQRVGGYYRNYLGRDADTAGAQVWLSLLQSGQMSPAQVAQAFLASDEFSSRAGTGLPNA